MLGTPTLKFKLKTKRKKRRKNTHTHTHKQQHTPPLSNTKKPKKGETYTPKLMNYTAKKVKHFQIRSANAKARLRQLHNIQNYSAERQ